MTYQYYSNLGCEYLEHGEISNAYEAFRTSLRLLHGGIGRRGQQLVGSYSQSSTLTSANVEMKPAHETTNTPPSNSTSLRRSTLILRRNSIRSVPSTSLITSHAGLALQTSALPMLPNGCTSFSDDPHREAQISSAVVVFNLGLVHHLSSQVDSQDTAADGLSVFHPHELLYKARALYVQSLRLLSSAIEPYGGTTTGNATVDLLYMNLLNNLAIISVAYGSEDPLEPQRLYSRLILLAISIKCKCYEDEEDDNRISTTGTSRTHDVGTLVDDQVAVFLSNASTLGLYAPSHASAA